MHLQSLTAILALLTLPLLGNLAWIFSPQAPPTGLQAIGAYETIQVPGCPALYGASIQANSLMFSMASNPQNNLVDDFAIEAVFCPTAVTHYHTLLWKGDRKAFPQQIQYYLSICNGKMEFKYKKANGDWVVHMTKAPVIIPQVWYHVIVRYKSPSAPA